MRSPADGLSRAVLRPIVAWFALASASWAAERPVRVTAPEAVVVAADGSARVRLTVEVSGQYHIFGTVASVGANGPGPNPTTVAAGRGAPFSLAGALETSPARKLFDPNFNTDVLVLEGRAWIDVPLRASPGLAAGRHRGSLVVSYQACDEQLCLPPEDVEVVIALIAGGSAGTEDPRWRRLEEALSAHQGGAEREVRWRENAELAWELQLNFPADPRRWRAWDTLLRSTPRFPEGSPEQRIWREREARLAASAANAGDAPEVLRELFAGKQVSALVLPHTNGVLPADWESRLVPPIERLAADFPSGSAAFVFFSRLVGAVEARFPEAMPGLVARLEVSPNTRVRELGAARRSVLRALEKPLDLAFTALDGRRVDTAEWRGKVVLVDFWATWCVPCIDAMPKLRELYARYHEQGLEIVNISVDQAAARPALEKLVARLELPWPQAFDGQGSRTEYAVRYGVGPIPHVLLAGRDGMIAAVNPRGDRLEAEVRRLLGLKP